MTVTSLFINGSKLEIIHDAFVGKFLHSGMTLPSNTGQI